MRYWRPWRLFLIRYIDPLLSEKWQERLGNYLYPDDCYIDFPKESK